MKRALLLLLVLLVALATYAQSAKPLAGYDVVVVQKIEVGSLAANSGYPAGYDGILQKTIYSKLATSKLFSSVIDATDSAAAPPADKKKVHLSGTIIGYDKGSRTARWMVGMGAGKSRVKVRFVCIDPSTNQELWRSDEEGTFSGTFEIGGGNESKAATESTRKVAENLVKKLTLAR